MSSASGSDDSNAIAGPLCPVSRHVGPGIMLADVVCTRSTDMPKALDDVLYAHRGVDAFHGGPWCTSDCPGYIAAHVDELPLMDAPGS